MGSSKIKTKDSISEPVITDFGDRRVSQQNFSKIVALPKTALTNCCIESQVNVKLVQFGKERFLKLSPSTKGDEKS
jgi:hypothetical protein